MQENCFKGASMQKGSDQRIATFQIDRIFLDRWSPRAMSGEEIPEEELMKLFEAARWAPSSMNNQPWRILYALRGSEHWPSFFNLLVDSNKVWCVNAAALVLFVSKTTHESGAPCRTHSYDCGAAWMSFALQGFMNGLVIHGMQGFDYDLARTSLGIPDGYDVEAMAAVGRPGRVEDLPENLQKREIPSGRRTADTTVCAGPFMFSR